MSDFRLHIRHNKQLCSFELSWDNGGCRFAETPYPESLTELYQTWQKDYFNFYSHRGLRGKGGGGSGKLNGNWELVLREAEARFLKEFYDWLKSPDLYEIRSIITKAIQINSQVNVFLTCNTITLAKLPWETWDIFDREKIRLFRTSRDRDEFYPRKRRRARILVIIGGDPKLNFEEEKKELLSLCKKADVEFVGWTPRKDIKALKTEIFDALTDSRGWDVLFFAGHSNETALTGGMIAIAPDIYLHIDDIREYLKIAKDNGLQFAIFNSCNGLSIADSLISLGLSQVVMMREPIDNEAALVFATKFLGELNQYKNVHDAFFTACQHLQLKENPNHPSAYLVPSLFCNPDTIPFRLQPSFEKQWLPTKAEALMLAGILLLSSLTDLKESLLDGRFLVQSITRNFPHFIQGYTSLPKNKIPPVLFIAIDQDSIDEAEEKDIVPNFSRNPIDRQYLAKLVDKLSQLKAKVIGIDYLLDLDETQKTKYLHKSIQNAVQSEQKTWFILAVDAQEKLYVDDELASKQWILEGDINFEDWNVKLPKDPSCSMTTTCPFAYLLTLSFKAQAFEEIFQLSLINSSVFQDQLNQNLNKESEFMDLLKEAYLPLELNSIIDFSINPDQVYQFISAKDLLNDENPPKNLDQTVVIIGQGGYKDAWETDKMNHLPLAISYWCSLQNNCQQRFSQNVFPLGYTHVYMVHHLLKQHRVIRIPDLWMIALAALGGKWVSLILIKKRSRQQNKWIVILGISTVAYGLFSIYLYIFASVLLPILSPTVCFWLYILFTLRSKQNV